MEMFQPDPLEEGLALEGEGIPEAGRSKQGNPYGATNRSDSEDAVAWIRPTAHTHGKSSRRVSAVTTQRVASPNPEASTP